MGDDKVVMAIVTLQADMAEVKESIVRIETKFDQLSGLVNTQDYMVKLLENMTAEQAANKSRPDRHEKRIEILETDVKQLQIAIQ